MPQLPTRKKNRLFLRQFPAKTFLLLLLATFGFKAEKCIATSVPLNTHCITASDYCDFLNATVNDLSRLSAENEGADFLYNQKMSDPLTGCIARLGEPGSYRYFVISGQEKTPVSYLNFLSAQAFCDWRETFHVSSSNDFSNEELSSSHFYFSIESTLSTSTLSMLTPAATADEGLLAGEVDAALLVLAGAAGEHINGMHREIPRELARQQEEPFPVLRERSQMSLEDAETHGATAEALNREIRKQPTITGDDYDALSAAYEKSQVTWKETLALHEDALSKASTPADILFIGKNIRIARTAIASWDAHACSLDYEKSMAPTGELFHAALKNYTEEAWKSFIEAHSTMIQALRDALHANKQALTYSLTEIAKEDVSKDVEWLQNEIDRSPELEEYFETEKNKALSLAAWIAETQRKEAAKAAEIEKQKAEEQARQEAKAAKKAARAREAAAKKAADAEQVRLANIAAEKEKTRLIEEALNAKIEATKVAAKRWEDDIQHAREADQISWLEKIYHTPGFIEDAVATTRDLWEQSKTGLGKTIAHYCIGETDPRKKTIFALEASAKKATNDAISSRNSLLRSDADTSFNQQWNANERAFHDARKAWTKILDKCQSYKDTLSSHSTNGFLEFCNQHLHEAQYELARITIESDWREVLKTTYAALDLKEETKKVASKWPETIAMTELSIEQWQRLIKKQESLKSSLHHSLHEKWDQFTELARYNLAREENSLLWRKAQRSAEEATCTLDEALRLPEGEARNKKLELAKQKSATTGEMWKEAADKYETSAVTVPSDEQLIWDDNKGKTHFYKTQYKNNPLWIETKSTDAIADTAFKKIKQAIEKSHQPSLEELQAAFDQAECAEAAWKKLVEKHNDLSSAISSQDQKKWNQFSDEYTQDLRKQSSHSVQLWQLIQEAEMQHTDANEAPNFFTLRWEPFSTKEAASVATKEAYTHAFSTLDLNSSDSSFDQKFAMIPKKFDLAITSWENVRDSYDILQHHFPSLIFPRLEDIDEPAYQIARLKLEPVWCKAMQTSYRASNEHNKARTSETSLEKWNQLEVMTDDAIEHWKNLFQQQEAVAETISLNKKERWKKWLDSTRFFLEEEKIFLSFRNADKLQQLAHTSLKEVLNFSSEKSRSEELPRLEKAFQEVQYAWEETHAQFTRSSVSIPHDKEASWNSNRDIAHYNSLLHQPHRSWLEAMLLNKMADISYDHLQEVIISSPSKTKSSKKKTAEAAQKLIKAQQEAKIFTGAASTSLQATIKEHEALTAKIPLSQQKGWTTYLAPFHEILEKQSQRYEQLSSVVSAENGEEH